MIETCQRPVTRLLSIAYTGPGWNHRDTEAQRKNLCVSHLCVSVSLCLGGSIAILSVDHAFEAVFEDGDIEID